MKIKEMIHKLVINPADIQGDSCWALDLKEKGLWCPDCGSHLIYGELQFGVIAEELNYGIRGYHDKRQYRLTEIGICFHCAECGGFIENYSKWFHPEDKLVITYEDIDMLDGVEKVEIEYCLEQFNQKKDFTPLYKYPGVDKLREKLLEYEKKHKLKKEVVKKKKNKLKKKIKK